MSSDGFPQSERLQTRSCFLTFLTDQALLLYKLHLFSKMCLLPLLSSSAKLAPEHEGSLASQGDSVLYVPHGHGGMAPTPKATSQSGVGETSKEIRLWARLQRIIYIRSIGIGKPTLTVCGSVHFADSQQVAGDHLPPWSLLLPSLSPHSEFAVW